ncbi:MAG: DUF2617 family protein, partial [Sciscionella sp.]
MRALLSTGYTDSSAADLSLAYGLPALPALGTHRVELPAAGVALRVLGASHQVVLDLGGQRWSETVACLPDGAGKLPEHDEVTGELLTGTFGARCERLAAEELTRRVAAVRQRCDRDPHALVGAFPGAPEAITALLVAEEGGGVRWWAWHA